MKNTQGSELYEQFVSILKNWGYDPGEHNKFEINEMVAVVTSSNQALLQKVREMVRPLESNLREAIDLVEAIRDGDYQPDSFTTQPWRIALEELGEKIKSLDTLGEQK